jgi:tetratricopeptide (TPR) repeat protein
LVLTFWLLLREEDRAADQSAWPGWRLVVLFAMWANVDGRFVLGLGFVALTWLGRALDTRSPGGFARAVGRWAAAVAILVGATCLSPSHVGGLRPPAELRSALAALRGGTAGDGQAVNSPFNPAYLDIFRDSPAALAYYPLLVLGLLSFVGGRREWRWAWFLPWLGLAVVSGLQVRLVPYFAVVAGPVTAWNLHAFFSRRASSTPVRSRLQPVGFALAVLLAAAFLISSWTGWLQGPPFEPRRWAVETPAGLERGAEFQRRTHAHDLWPPETRTLHGSADTAAAFAWFCPEDPGLRDDRLVAQLIDPRETEGARQRLRELAVTRVALFAGDSGTAALLSRFFASPDEWPLLSMAGGVAVFGWRDPDKPADLFSDWAVDFDRLAFQPDSHEVAPAARPPGQRRWWDAFRKPAPPAHPPGRDEATILLRKAEAMVQTAPARHHIAWEIAQTAGLAGAASGWTGVGGLYDASLRVAFLRPPVPETGPLPEITDLTVALRRQFEFERGDAPVGLVYASIRAARRSVAENPFDPSSHLALGLAYGELVRFTAERSWAARFPELVRLRQIQASAALNRALALNPKLAIAHLELARLYLTLECLDLAVVHFRTYLESPRRFDGPAPGSDQAKEVAAQLDQLTTLLDRQRREFARESERSSVSDRAHMAVRRGLGGEARDLLLKSDLAAFGTVGMELELDLLLRTGRPDDVLDWMTPEVRGSIGESAAQWLSTQAYAAVGEYEAANSVLLEITSSTGSMPEASLLAREIGLRLGKAVLDEAFGAQSPPHAVLLAINRSRYRNQIDDMTLAAGRSAEITVLRGLIALEAGFIDRARDAFHDSLSLSPNRAGGGQLNFKGRSIARECLMLVNGASPPRPAVP